MIQGIDLVTIKLLCNLGNTVPSYKGRADAPHRVRTRDLAKPAIAQELGKERVPARYRKQVLAGLRVRVLRGTPVGPCARARAPGVQA